jgi:hypothetical protein
LRLIVSNDLDFPFYKHVEIPPSLASAVEGMSGSQIPVLSELSELLEDVPGERGKARVGRIGNYQRRAGVPIAIGHISPIPNRRCAWGIEYRWQLVTGLARPRV